MNPSRRWTFDEFWAYEIGTIKQFGEAKMAWMGVLGAEETMKVTVEGSYYPSYIYRNTQFKFYKGSKVHLLDAHGDLNKAIKNFNEQSSKDIEQLNELVENYESTPAEFDRLFSDAFASRGQEVETIWKRRSAMLAHIKADEWPAIISSAKAEAAEDKK